MSADWRDIFNQMSWENYYILDADDCGIAQARQEKRVKLAGEEFRKYLMVLCEIAERQGMDRAMERLKDAINRRSWFP